MTEYERQLHREGFGHGPLTPGEVRLLRDVLCEPEADHQAEPIPDVTLHVFAIGCIVGGAIIAGVCAVAGVWG